MTELSDGEITQHYVVAVAAAVFREGKVLAMRRSPARDAGPGLWETLSGRLWRGEDPVDAVAREIVEECGLSVRVWPRPVTAYQATRAGEPMVVIVFRADADAGEVRRTAEHDAHAWLTPEEFAATSSLLPLVEAVRKAAALAGSARR
ncbi:MAG TPA: NUDIX domain-containing protein [Trueperaceae bacterium]|nr:NUDIX domain-containing protein [Trueperaceae bacterium]